MMRLNSNRISMLITCLALLLAFPALAQAQMYGGKPQTGLTESLLVIRTETGVAHEFTVEIAETPMQQAVSMMFRPHVPRDRGMLFPFPATKETSFWMKNTLSSLDLLFIRADGTIAHIYRRAEPLSLEPIPSTEPVAAVLEIAGGEADRRDIREGDHVEHGFFQ